MPLRPSEPLLPGPVSPVVRRWDVGAAVDAAPLHGLGLPPLVASVLLARGHRDSDGARAFLQPSLRDLPDPRRLPDLDVAVARLLRARRDRERVVVHGDYDVDGCTSTAVLVGFFAASGIDVGWYAPHRVRDGYGIQPTTVRRLAEQGARVLITCDNGTSAFPALELAASLGVDVIVVDHHRLPPTLPPCTALVNPKRLGDDDPLSELAAVGVAFMLLVGLRAGLRAEGTYRSSPEPDLRDWLDLVALGTVADMAPLVAVNRVLVSAGLTVLAGRRRPGLAALLDVSGVAPDAPLRASHLGFQLGPRVNAAGRLDEASRAVDLLLSDEPAECRRIAEDLHAINDQRRQLERAIFDDAVRQATPFAERRGALVLWSPDWHPGVVGIVAAKVSRHFHRPALMLAEADGLATGSGRAISGIDLFATLSSVAPLLERFGGHRAAAGLTVRRERLAELRDALSESAFAASPASVWEPRLRADLPADPDDIDLDVVRALQRLGPFGLGNPEPQFFGANLRPSAVRAVARGGIKLDLRGRGRALPAIGFGIAAETFARPSVDAIYCAEENRYRGKSTAELRLVDARPSA